MKKRKKETVFLGDEIKEYLSKFTNTYKKRVFSQETKKSLNLLSIWQSVVPPHLLKHTDNVVYSKRSQNNEILVFVDSAAYATELTMDKEMYRYQMEKKLGVEVSDIKFLVSRKTALRKKR